MYPAVLKGGNHILIYFLLKPSVNLVCSNCAHIYTDDFIDKTFGLIYTDGSSSSIYCTFSQSMKWTEEHEVLMLREVILMRPWQHRKGTSETAMIGKNWQFP